MSLQRLKRNRTIEDLVISKAQCIVYLSAVLALNLAIAPVAKAQSSAQAVTTAAVSGHIGDPAGAQGAGVNAAISASMGTGAAVAPLSASENSASSVAVDNEDLNALFNDPNELARELSALAGPSAGPDAGQIYSLVTK